MRKIILASASPRRKEILRNLGITFQVITSKVEEIIDIDLEPSESVTKLALSKAKNVYQHIDQQRGVIIAADTVVVDDKILGKPVDENDAFNTLKRLSGKKHQVITGFAIIDIETQKFYMDYDCTDVYFNSISDEIIRQYIATGEPMDKAGSYGIQGRASLFIKKIEGDYFNVVGLPVFKLGEALQNHFHINLLK